MKTSLLFLMGAVACLSSCATDAVPEAQARPLRSVPNTSPDAVGSHRFYSVHSYTWDKSAGPAYSNAADFYQRSE